MSIDLVEQCSAPAGSVRIAAPILARIKELARRFPIVSSGMLSLIDQAVVSGTSFATAIIVARWTSQDQLGLYYLTLSIVMIMLGIQDQVVACPYIIYASHRKRRELAEYTGSSWFHHLVLTAMFSVMLMLAVFGLSIAGSVKLVPGLWAIAWVGPLLLLREAIRRFALADLRLTTAIAVDVPVAIVQIGGLLLLGYSGNLSLLTVFATMGGACALASFGWFLFRQPRARFRRQRFLPDWLCNWSFSKWALQGYLVGNLTPFVMLWILNAMVDTAAAGVFGACVTLLGVTNVFVLGVANVLLPQSAKAFSKGGTRGLRRILMQTTGFLTLVLGTLCLGIMLGGERLAVLVYGSRFEGCGLILVALAFNVLFGSLQMAAGNGLWVIHQARSNFVADLWWTSVTLLSAALLIPSWGVLGAALATVAGSATGMLVRWWTLLRALERFPHSADSTHPLATSQT